MTIQKLMYYNDVLKYFYSQKQNNQIKPINHAKMDSTLKPVIDGATSINVSLKSQKSECIDFDIFATSTPEAIEDFFNKNSDPITRKVRVGKTLKEQIKISLNNVIENSPSKIKSVQNPAESLTTHANNILKNYIYNTPEYKSITEQIIECKKLIVKFTYYDCNNRLEYYKEKFAELKEQRKQFDNILNSNNYYKSTSKNNQNSVNIKSSIEKDVYLIAFKQKEAILHSQLQQSSPYYLVEKMRVFREQLNLRNIYGKVIIEDFDDIFNNVDMTLDYSLTEQELSEERISDVMVSFTYPEDEIIDIVKKSDNILIEKYDECCKYIGKIINITYRDIADMPLGTIFSNLKKTLASKDEKLIEEYEYVRLMIMNRMSEIYSEANNEKFTVSELVFNNFSVLTPDGERKAKELLASSSIKTVKGIAYRICSKYKNLEKYDDAISYGLVGLTLAINKYIEMQKSQPDQCINFKTLINSFISSTIKTGFVEMSSMGTASTSHIQRQNMILNKRVKNFIKFNPEYANADKDELRDMLAEDDNFMSDIRITYESQFNVMMENSTEENANEIWDIVCKSKENLMAFTESKSDHRILMTSIKKMLNLFEPSYENSAFSVGKKLFDKYDSRLFEMSFGFDYKRSSGDTKSNGSANYTQAEMGKELEKMYKMEGINKTFSQPAIATRLTKIYEKIKFAVKTNPSLKRAFEYINTVYYENHEYMNIHSNNRESESVSFTDTKFERVKLPICEEDITKLRMKKISITGCMTNKDLISSEICDMFNQEML